VSNFLYCNFKLQWHNIIRNNYYKYTFQVFIRSLKILKADRNKCGIIEVKGAASPPQSLSKLKKRGSKQMSSSLPPQEHDSTFKLLFENPKDILFLVKHVIGYSWAKDIEEDSIELADKEFVDETFKQKRADVIAKARLKDREVYFYILIENQSKVDEDMAERLLKYMIMLWARKIREGAEKLPAIIPIVTYNGLKEKWDVTRDIIDAFEIFKENIFRYELVDLSKLNVVDLFEREEGSLVPVVFYLEQARDDASELTRRLSRIVPVLEKMDEHNRERFAILVKNIIEPRLNERQRIEVEKMTKTLLQGGEKNG